jgi:pimeloyl-ACP methyl ester carboxylesterase
VLPAAVANGQLVVLVHGLCSTDVGTFADFETLLRGRPNVHVAGFPHDSLTTSIDDNARELAQVIRLLGKAGIRLVCHSRGGLVARRTHLLLQQKPPSAGAWIHSCVTFGTPHLGTSVASSPISLTFACMALAHLARSPGVASLVDVLCACTGEGLVGVSELLPSRVKDSYLARLEAAENRLFLNEGFNLHVFGSVAPQSSLWTRLVAGMITRVVGTPDHDLLVPTRSSLPRLEGVGPHAPIAGRSHFEYFTRQNAVDPPHFAAAVQRLGL